MFALRYVAMLFHRDRIKVGDPARAVIDNGQVFGRVAAVSTRGAVIDWDDGVSGFIDRQYLTHFFFEGTEYVTVTLPKPPRRWTGQTDYSDT